MLPSTWILVKSLKIGARYFDPKVGGLVTERDIAGEMTPKNICKSNIIVLFEKTP